VLIDVRSSRGGHGCRDDWSRDEDSSLSGDPRCERPKKELIDSIRAIARRKGMVVPKNDGSLVAANVEIDSLSVIEILCVLDEILPFEVGESVVRAGGYGSIQEAVDDVTASVEKEWINHHHGGVPT